MNAAENASAWLAHRLYLASLKWGSVALQMAQDAIANDDFDLLIRILTDKLTKRDFPAEMREYLPDDMPA